MPVRKRHVSVFVVWYRNTEERAELLPPITARDVHHKQTVLGYCVDHVAIMLMITLDGLHGRRALGAIYNVAPASPRSQPVFAAPSIVAVKLLLTLDPASRLTYREDELRVRIRQRNLIVEVNHGCIEHCSDMLLFVHVEEKLFVLLFRGIVKEEAVDASAVEVGRVHPEHNKSFI